MSGFATVSQIANHSHIASQSFDTVELRNVKSQNCVIKWYVEILLNSSIIHIWTLCIRS